MIMGCLTEVVLNSVCLNGHFKAGVRTNGLICLSSINAIFLPQLHTIDLGNNVQAIFSGHPSSLLLSQ